MRKRVGAMVISAALLCLGGIPRTARAQSGSVETDIKKDYKVAGLGSDSTGTVVTEAGTVLAVKKGGIRAYPPKDMAILPNVYKDGNLKGAPAKTMGKIGGLLGSHLPGAAQSADKGDNSRLLPVDTKVYATKIAVDAAHDKVNVTVIECDSCNNVQQPSSFRALVEFDFPKGYLQGADAGQVEDMLAQVLLPDKGDANAQQGQDQQQQQQAQAAAPAAAEPPKAPQSIEKGQTEEQVIAAFGQPDKVVNLGVKKLLIYKDMKVTLIAGKVADVQ
jgi:hypothetical protein